MRPGCEPRRSGRVAQHTTAQHRRVGVDGHRRLLAEREGALEDVQPVVRLLVLEEAVDGSLKASGWEVEEWRWRRRRWRRRRRRRWRRRWRRSRWGGWRRWWYRRRSCLRWLRWRAVVVGLVRGEEAGPSRLAHQLLGRLQLLGAVGRLADLEVRLAVEVGRLDVAPDRGRRTVATPSTSGRPEAGSWGHGKPPMCSVCAVACVGAA